MKRKIILENLAILIVALVIGYCVFYQLFVFSTGGWGGLGGFLDPGKEFISFIVNLITRVF